MLGERVKSAAAVIVVGFALFFLAFTLLEALLETARQGALATGPGVILWDDLIPQARVPEAGVAGPGPG